MRCEEVRTSLNLYLDGVLAREEREAVEVHLAGCEQCRAELDSLSAMVGLVRGLPMESPEPAAEETVLVSVFGETAAARSLVAGCREAASLVPELLDGVLTPARRGRLLAHLGGCAGCRQSVAEQQDVQVAVCAMPEVEAPERLESGILARTTRVPAPAYRLRPAPVRWGVLRWALAPVTAAALIGIALLWPRTPGEVAFRSQPVPPLVAEDVTTKPSSPATTEIASAPGELLEELAPAATGSRTSSRSRAAGSRLTRSAGAETAPRGAVGEPAGRETRPAAAPASAFRLGTERVLRLGVAPAGPVATVIAEAPAAAPARHTAAPSAPSRPAAVRLVRATGSAEIPSAPAPVRSRPEEYALTPRPDFSRETGRLEDGAGGDRYASLGVVLSSF